MNTPKLSVVTALLAAALLTAAPARADEVRLKDGRVLVGDVVERGDTLEITTRDGVVRAQVVQIGLVNNSAGGF